MQAVSDHLNRGALQLTEYRAKYRDVHTCLCLEGAAGERGSQHPHQGPGAVQNRPALHAWQAAHVGQVQGRTLNLSIQAAGRISSLPITLPTRATVLLGCALARNALHIYLVPDGVGHDASRNMVAEQLRRDGPKRGTHPVHSTPRLQSGLCGLLLGLCMMRRCCRVHCVQGLPPFPRLCASEHRYPGEQGLPPVCTALLRAQQPRSGPVAASCMQPFRVGRPPLCPSV